jgi:membrane-associated phospholipid phosphatase
MSGAHWFTDIAVGSVSIVLVVMSWVLLTPFSDRMIQYLESKLPLSFF